MVAAMSAEGLKKPLSSLRHRRLLRLTAISYFTNPMAGPG